MLDSNLPTYFFRPSTDRTSRHDYSLLFTQHDSDPEPRYTLRFPDPSTPIAKNLYACALFDAYVPDLNYGEVLLRPNWQQPTLSAQEIRAQNGVPPAPAPLIPAEFGVQLYNPDQQVVVTEKRANWGSDTYHFSMPQMSFRTPSASSLDRGANDPLADATTPLLRFMWKKEGSLSNNIVCYLTGKSTDTNKKKKGGKEPDIMVAILHNYRDITLYESNFHRIDMEDYKGLEVVLLLSAWVIRDVYCQQRKDCFNTGEAPRKNSGGILGRKKSTPMLNGNASSMNLTSPAAVRPPGPTPPPRPGSAAQPHRISNSPYGRAQSTPPLQAPPPDAREQWQIDAEATRLRKQQESEKRTAEARRQQQAKADEMEARRIRKMIEAEDKERRKREAEVERETARLRKKYGDQANLLESSQPPRPPQRQSAPMYGHAAGAQTSVNLGGYQGAAGPSTYLHPYGAQGGGRPAASMLNLGGQVQQQAKPKKSFLGLRRSSDERIPVPQTLHKKKSSFW
ncbi:hypothetical protein BT63DRAFT_424338 [Microthyrium microscopicum]|uniref:Uncharacterized protein n=1 Tax=Microthyrium microscopicum TaxID=703497 RepID=A0A6A6UDN9_9PEZI|nr:hypothetical protein BT63DRAFT_424338 [Microthyrium microscopicum]